MNETQTASQSRIENAGAAENRAEGTEPQRTFTVRHNKEERELTLDELLAAAEKGLDYDRIRPSHDFVKQLAAEAGESDVSRYIESVEQKKKTGGEADFSRSTESSGSRPGEFAQLLAEYPEALKNGKIELPKEAETLVKDGMSLLDACRLNDLNRTKAKCRELEDLLEAEKTNRSNAFAAVGSLTGGDAVEKDFYTSREWDELPAKTKENLVKSGKIYKFMRKWSGKE